ncbi:unnamed protein product [Lepeophtheirus salmonis]|uniref:(salmon louse) hypothetical protein n=1 Tax=Lepeophtheirus salmonis TaxID=72036 RepID=A0A7R8CMI1_LEPSM|nr:unnamed protein product [Lepeophtheirus salmonis]CAF2837843.1 unnamed protein product [Lepeophtheirus salmonis]
MHSVTHESILRKNIISYSEAFKLYKTPILGFQFQKELILIQIPGMEKRSHRPKAFSSSTSNILAVMDGDGYKRSASENGNQFWNSASPTPAPLPETKQHRSQDKIRHPHQMYTDSSVYQPKHHPSVADQVKMAHQLSSSLFADANKESQGQEMFFKRVQTSDPQSKHQGVKVHPHRPPNMKLVMNPEGKLHDWTDLPKEEISELANVVSHHFSQTENDIQRNGGDNYSSYKDIFESRRNVFTNIMDNAFMTPSHSSPQWNHNNNNRNMNLNYMNRTKQGLSVSNQNYIHRQQTGQPSSHFPQSNYDILRSKTAPSLASTPKLPKRGGSKYVMPNYENRPSIEKFFV